MKRYFLLFFFFAGCSNYTLTVERQVVSSSYLASEQIQTKDLARNNSWKGENLIVCWNVPEKEVGKSSFLVTVRRFDLQEESSRFLVEKSSGSKKFFFPVFCPSESILMYQVSLLDEKGEKLAFSESRMWTKVILPKEEYAF